MIELSSAMGNKNFFFKSTTSITSIVLSGLLTLASCTSEAQKSDKEFKILAFGDSLTAGYKLPAQEAYPSLLEKMLAADGYKVQITNAGVSGETTEQGLRRVDWVLKQNKFDFVLLGLGANDGLRQLPISNMESNLNQLISKFKAAQVKVILLGMQLPANLFRGYRGEFENSFKKVAEKNSVPFYPFLLEGVAANSNLNLDDQIHPNAKGYEIIAKNIKKFLEPHLK